MEAPHDGARADKRKASTDMIAPTDEDRYRAAERQRIIDQFTTLAIVEKKRARTITTGGSRARSRAKSWRRAARFVTLLGHPDPRNTEAWIRADQRKALIEVLRTEHGSRHHAAVHVLLAGKCIEPLCRGNLLDGFVVCERHERETRLERGN